MTFSETRWGTPRALLRSGDGWLAFDRPQRILRAEAVDEVPSLLETLRELVSDGHWVVGYLAYDAAPAFDPAFEAHPPAGDLPLAWWGVFDRPRRLAELPAAPAGEDREEDETQDEATVSEITAGWRPGLDREAHRRAVEEVRRRIEIGDTYQVNLTFPLETCLGAMERDQAFELFRRLVSWAPPPHAAFLDVGGDGQSRYVLSASPELFFRAEAKTGRGSESSPTRHSGATRVVTRPMKGTAARGRFPAEDGLQRDRLLSEKNRAENLMIADMMRNDLGRVARPGSVRVGRLFEIETYPTVHQLVTEVEALLEEDRDAFDVLRALFPCASITGAPKARSTGLIRELEPVPRGIYTGSIGYFAADGSAELNVAIRTLTLSGAQARYGTGGGIVWDSKADDEFAEALTKSRVLDALERPAAPFRLLETLLWRPPRATDGSGFFLLDRHLDRQAASARYFGFVYDRPAMEERLHGLAESWCVAGHGRSRVRLLAARDGGVEVERHDAPCRGRRVYTVCLDDRPVDESDPFLYHKTTRRRIYEAAARRHPEADEVILWNSRGELTEATRANLVLRRGDRWLTPPVASGLLAGTYRQAGIARGRLEERVLRPDDLDDADAIFLINSVRGWMRCRLVGGTFDVPDGR